MRRVTPVDLPFHSGGGGLGEAKEDHEDAGRDEVTAAAWLLPTGALVRRVRNHSHSEVSKQGGRTPFDRRCYGVCC